MWGYATGAEKPGPPLPACPSHPQGGAAQVLWRDIMSDQNKKNEKASGPPQRSVTKAPSPTSPVSGLSYTPTIEPSEPGKRTIDVDWIDGGQLIERWNIDAFILRGLIWEHGFPAYNTSTLKPVFTYRGPNAWMAYPISGMTEADMGRITVLSIDQQKKELRQCLRFQLSDVEAFEQNYPELLIRHGSGTTAKDSVEYKPTAFRCPDESDIPEEVVSLINKIRPELESIYEAVKEGEGFSEQSRGAAQRRQKDAINFFEAYPTDFSILKEEDLNKTDVYAVTNQQTKRAIIGKLLQRVVIRNGYGSYSYQKLYARTTPYNK